MDTATETDESPNFLIFQQEDMNQALQPLTEDQPRKKRVHRKSRLGCLACKRRRVKCNERIPCSNCVKRKEQCVRSNDERSISRSLSTPKAHLVNGPEDAYSPINLMHMELFHHFEHMTLPTLSFPEVWPKVLRQAFNEEFIMSTILCVAAAHLATITPNNTRYCRARNQLLTKSLRLLRLNLSRQFTKDICDALAGTTVLINYISWCHLEFLSEQQIEQSSETSNIRGLDLSQDQLFLLSPGVLQVYLQGLPVFLEEDSVFLAIGRQHPRLNIEEVLIRRGEDPIRFVEPFMKIFDDPYFQTSYPERDSPGIFHTFRRTWAFLSELEFQIGQAQQPCTFLPQSPDTTGVLSMYHGKSLEDIRDGLLKLQHDNGLATPESQPGKMPLEIQFIMPQRTALECVVRRLSPILCCLAAPKASSQATHPTGMPRKADLKRLLFTFPVFCCVPMLQMMAQGDARALLLLFHFYRAVRVLLPTEDTWWAGERSRRLEGLILADLEARGYTGCVRKQFGL